MTPNLDRVTVEPGHSAKGQMLFVCDVEIVDGELVTFNVGGKYRYHIFGSPNKGSEYVNLSMASVADESAADYPNWPYPEPATEAA